MRVDLQSVGKDLFSCNFFYNSILTFHRYNFPCSIERIDFGTWRQVTDAGKLALKRSLLAASNNPFSPLDDYKNLKTGIKNDETILIFPKSWSNLGKLSKIFLTFH